jgi:hypothetical protein
VRRSLKHGSKTLVSNYSKLDFSNAAIGGSNRWRLLVCAPSKESERPISRFVSGPPERLGAQAGIRDQGW